MRPTRVSVVPSGAITNMRSKPSACRRKSVTTTECPSAGWPPVPVPPVPMREATTEPPPSQRVAWARAVGPSLMSPCSRASWMAATVRPGVSRSQVASNASAEIRSGWVSPSPATAGKGCTME